ncbi:MAG: pentapeptide repeat-containing protein [Oscillospiraceae bacterium]|nr:pentapeptide repeat-containing protein [Oscillospiraceae bacterium]
MPSFSDKEYRELKYTAGDVISDMSFENCSFLNCVFDACTFERCVFSSCSFTSCSFVSPMPKNTDMRFCDFRRCRIIGVSFMSFVDDEYIRKPVNSMLECRLKYCLFHDMSFPDYDFSSNEFSQCEFTECALNGAVFRKCDLAGTSFSNSDLRRADFRQADGYVIDIFNNKLKDARFSSPEVLNLLSSLHIEIE